MEVPIIDVDAERVGMGIYLGDFPEPCPLAEPGYLKKIAGLGCDDRVSRNYIS